MISWLDELRLEPGPPFTAMGTHTLDLDQWLLVDDERVDSLGQKHRLLATRPELVAATLPGSQAAGAEVLRLIESWLRDHDVEPAPIDIDEHPLVAAARLVQEDLVVMERIDGQWILTAGVVCFPTHWCVADKIGQSLAAIHGPVAHYADELRDKVDRFHDRLRVDHPVWRRNWFVLASDELHLPESSPPPLWPPVIHPDGTPMWIRSERQTLRRLADTDAILFTIRVQRAPLGVLLARRDLAAQMLAATSSWDDAKRRYTSTGGVLNELIEWLRPAAADHDQRR